MDADASADAMDGLSRVAALEQVGGAAHSDRRHLDNAPQAVCVAAIGTRRVAHSAHSLYCDRGKSKTMRVGEQSQVEPDEGRATRL